MYQSKEILDEPFKVRLSERISPISVSRVARRFCTYLNPQAPQPSPIVTGDKDGLSDIRKKPSADCLLLAIKNGVRLLSCSV